MIEKRLAIGLECQSIDEKKKRLEEGYDFIAIDILDKTIQENFLKYSSLTDDNVCIHEEDISNVFIFVPSWIQIDSLDEKIANKSIQILYDEVQYVSYIGILNFILPPLTQKKMIPQYARMINHLLFLSSYTQFYIFFPIEDDLIDSSELWDIWNTLRTSFNIQHKLPEPIATARWFAEPGYPVLPKTHQTFYNQFIKLKPNILLRISNKIFDTNNSLEYLQYLRYLEQNIDPPTAIEKFADGYQDYLQIPLQPLADNLESLTYGIFEKDHVKYNLYESAIYRALVDRFESKEPIYIAVVGAGRGPLISRSLKAAENAHRKIVLYAIEKNPNAFVTLQYRNRCEWRNSVNLVNTDMRLWNPPVLIDIILSELLGSLGDNELSPECLDGAQRFLNTNGGIFIPSSYTAYITPLMTPKLYGNILRLKDPAAFESFYVIWLHSMNYLAQDDENRFQVLWKFIHPSSNCFSNGEKSNFHNIRKSKNTFNISSKGMLHGFAGYFEAILYDDIELSTRPDTMDEKSKDMVSWFPAFFPLKVPLYVPSNSQVDLYFWRQTDSKKVWYEWLTEVYILSSEVQNNKIIHNYDRIKIGISDLHNYNASFSSITL
ncbi:hypothetical protein PCANB_002651 [Pneumocystis canis]|nr:hypothetical protein PCANB_002651 [Pneumocystis canis]